MHNKRGIEVTFSWVFSIIAGAVIFLFFVGFAAENMDFFGKLTAVKVSEELNNAFSGLKTGLVSTEIGFDKDIKLQFRCIDGKKEKLIVGYRSGKNLYDNIVFSPETLEGNEFLLMTKAWNVPYKVDNFIFISDKNKIYSLNGNNGEFDKLKDDLPTDFQPLIKKDSENGKKINFEYNSGDCSALEKDNKGIKINYQEDINDNWYGTICGEEWGPKPFYGDTMIYAAIFGDQFECLYPLLKEKLKIMSEVYSNKASSVGANEIVGKINKLTDINEIHNYYGAVETSNKAVIGSGSGAIF